MSAAAENGVSRAWVTSRTGDLPKPGTLNSSAAARPLCGAAEAPAAGDEAPAADEGHDGDAGEAPPDGDAAPGEVPGHAGDDAAGAADAGDAPLEGDGHAGDDAAGADEAGGDQEAAVPAEVIVLAAAEAGVADGSGVERAWRIGAGSRSCPNIEREGVPTGWVFSSGIGALRGRSGVLSATQAGAPGVVLSSTTDSALAASLPGRGRTESARLRNAPFGASIVTRSSSRIGNDAGASCSAGTDSTPTEVKRYCVVHFGHVAFNPPIGMSSTPSA